MAEGGSSALFVGDLADPWVATLASALPPATPRLDCPSFLPEPWPPSGLQASVVVLHRAFLSNTDADRLFQLRNRPAGPPRVVLCIGPHVRAFQLERWRALVDLILPEATASEILARYASPPDAFAPLRNPASSRPRIVVVSSNFELRLMLADACQRAGYPAQPVASWSDAPPDWPALWDIPVLEPNWPEVLKHQAAARRILALIPFADRDSVSLARSLGASACLELPVDPADLAFVLDRMTSTLNKPSAIRNPAHAVPPPPMGLFKMSRPQVRTDQES